MIWYLCYWEIRMRERAPIWVQAGVGGVVAMLDSTGFRKYADIVSNALFR